MHTGDGNGPDRFAEELAFDLSMNHVHETVEWGYKDIRQYSTTLDCQSKLQIRKIAVSKQHLCGVLLCNTRSCLCGNHTASFFGSAPPSLK